MRSLRPFDILYSATVDHLQRKKAQLAPGKFLPHYRGWPILIPNPEHSEPEERVREGHLTKDSATFLQALLISWLLQGLVYGVPYWLLQGFTLRLATRAQRC